MGKCATSTSYSTRCHWPIQATFKWPVLKAFKLTKIGSVKMKQAIAKQSSSQVMVFKQIQTVWGLMEQE